MSTQSTADYPPARSNRKDQSMASATDLPRIRHLLGTEWSTEGPERLEHVSPTTGQVQANFSAAGADEVDRAVSAARAAFAQWRAVAPGKRRQLLERLSALILSARDEFRDIGVAECGTPVRQGGGAVLAARYTSYFAGWADKLDGLVAPVGHEALDYVLPQPYGVVAALIPWNAPVPSLGMKLSPALATGNCVVLKPSPLAPFATVRFVELCQQAGFPPGVVNLIQGDGRTGELLVGHPGVNKITFTGGVETGRAVMRMAANNLTPVTLELGGKGALVAFDDVDAQRVAADAVAFSVGTLAGQACALPTRVIVAQSRYAEVVAALMQRYGDLRMGDPADEKTDVGPLISAVAQRRVVGVIERARDSDNATIVTGGKAYGGPSGGGFWVEPTLVADVAPDASVVQDEIFGPVVTVQQFADEAEAVALANGTKYGLSAFIYTDNLKRAHRVARDLEAGYISVNGFAYLPPETPFGGWKSSGFGREGGRAGVEDFVQTKNVYVPLGE
jgi:acyl-CoA reductase-like NAD-dependent aldehyde dehydrogenase